MKGGCSSERRECALWRQSCVQRFGMTDGYEWQEKGVAWALLLATLRLSQNCVRAPLLRPSPSFFTSTLSHSCAAVAVAVAVALHRPLMLLLPCFLVARPFSILLEAKNRTSPPAFFTRERRKRLWSHLQPSCIMLPLPALLQRLSVLHHPFPLFLLVFCPQRPRSFRKHPRV